jgi:hypothetical protein
MQEFAAFSQRDHLQALISSAAGRFAYADLDKSFVDVINGCYEGIHSQLKRQCREESCGERERLDRIWMQRNVRHGTFLKGVNFSISFFETDGTIAATIGTLPFLLLFGLISDPKEFLSFRPCIGKAS